MELINKINLNPDTTVDFQSISEKFTKTTDKERKSHLQQLHETGKLVEFIRTWPNSASWEDPTGKTLLATVAELGFTRAAELLIENKADINKGDRDNWTPLYRACNATCELEMVELLIRKGAVVDAVNADAGSNVLHRLASYGNHQAINLILRHNSSIEFLNCVNVFASPLYFAKQKGCAKTIKILQEHEAAVHYYKPSDPLMLAAYNGDIKKLRTLLTLDPRAHSNEDAFSKRTPLDFACEQGKLDAVRFLIEAGAQIDHQDHRMEYHPLEWAVQGEHIEIVKLLLKHSADLTCLTDLYGWPCSHKAAQSGNVEILQLLIDYSTNPVEAVSSTDNRGRTLLHKAYLSGNQEMIEYCTNELGLQPTKDNEGRFPGS